MIKVEDLKFNNEFSNILIVGDNNYFIDNSNIEVEVISDKLVDCFRCIKVSDFLNNIKNTFYYTYKNIIIEEDYVYLFDKLKYYFEDHDFELIIVLSPDYLIENSDVLISLLENTKFDSIIEENEEFILIRVSR